MCYLVKQDTNVGILHPKTSVKTQDSKFNKQNDTMTKRIYGTNIGKSILSFLA
jgi:hypothetical protein